MSLQVGASEWVQASLGYAGGVNFGFKGRILDEYTNRSPSLAIGIRNMFHNETLARSRLQSDVRDLTSEFYAALGKGSDLFATRFHAGLLSLPNSDRDRINGFAAIEKYFSDDFFLTLEGFTQQRKFYLALTATLRFAERNNVEMYMSLLDMERIFATNKRDFGVSLTPRKREDWVKPGIMAGFSISLGAKQRWIDERAQFRTIEDNFARHDTLIKTLSKQVDTLKKYDAMVTDLQSQIDTVKWQIDSLKVAIGMIDTLPVHYSEVYSRIVAYTRALSAERFDPIEVRRILDEIRKYGEDGEIIVAKVAKEETERWTVKVRAVTILGELKSKDKVAMLVDMLDEATDSRLKVEIITTLGKINDRIVMPKIEEYADSYDENLRIAAREVLELWTKTDKTNKSNVKTKENIPLDKGNDVFSIEPLEEIQ
jgi:hypothetical protein